MRTDGSDSSSTIAAQDDRPDTKRGLELAEKVELVVVLMLAVLPDLFTALVTYYNPQLMQGMTEYMSGSLIVRSISVSSVVLYLIWRSKQSWELFGLKRVHWFSALLGGFALAGLVVGIWWAFCMAMYQVLPIEVFQELFGKQNQFIWKPSNDTQLYLLLLALVCNSFAEELVMRGYMLTRLQQWLGSSWRACLLAAALFASYHVYQGILGLVFTFLNGVLFGAAFLIWRRLWPLVVAHTLINMWAFFGG